MEDEKDERVVQFSIKGIYTLYLFFLKSNNNKRSMYYYKAYPIIALQRQKKNKNASVFKATISLKSHKDTVSQPFQQNCIRAKYERYSIIHLSKNEALFRIQHIQIGSLQKKKKDIGYDKVQIQPNVYIGIYEVSLCTFDRFI